MAEVGQMWRNFDANGAAMESLIAWDIHARQAHPGRFYQVHDVLPERGAAAFMGEIVFGLRHMRNRLPVLGREDLGVLGERNSAHGRSSENRLPEFRRFK